MTSVSGKFQMPCTIEPQSFRVTKPLGNWAVRKSEKFVTPKSKFDLHCAYVKHRTYSS